MDRSVPRGGLRRTNYAAPRARAAAPVTARHSRAAATTAALGSAVGRAARFAARLTVALVVLAAGVLLLPGVLLDTPQPAPQPAQAIVVISGDEQMARFQEGVALYQRGYGQYLVFSGAAYDNGTSNADVMRDLAVDRGVPVGAILQEPLGGDTWGNAIFTRQVLEREGLRSAILVTSPYHARRAKLTFDAAYAGSGIDLTVHAAPDSQWRKLSWWRSPETRRLTGTELQKLLYIAVTGQYH